MKLNEFGRADSKEQDDKMRLTLGSAVRDGKLLTMKTKSDKGWTLASVDEGGRRTQREDWEQSTLGSNAEGTRWGLER